MIMLHNRAEREAKNVGARV